MTYQDDFNRTLDPERMLYLLRNHSDEIDPSDVDNLAIRGASIYGYTEVVKELLKDSRVNPSSKNNRAIKMASRGGHIEVVKELLKDKRVDLSYNIDAIKWASHNGHTEIVKLLEDHIKFVRNKKLYCRMLIHI